MSNPWEPGADATSQASAVAFASNTTWTWVVMGTMVLTGGVDAMGLFIETASIFTDTRSHDWVPFMVLTVVLGLGTLVMLPTNVITWLVWQYRAANNAVALSALSRPRFEFGPGTSLVWWFVPFANLVMPYRVVAAIWQASNTPLSEPLRQDARLVSWWGLWITSNVTSNIAFRMTGWEADVTLEASIAMWLSHALSLGAAIAAFGLVRQINDTQERAGKAMAEISPSRALPA